MGIDGPRLSSPGSSEVAEEGMTVPYAVCFSFRRTKRFKCYRHSLPSGLCKARR